MMGASVCCSAGITRLQRWERAQLHGLNPPEDVRELLLQAQTQDKHGLKYKHLKLYLH